MNAVAKLPENSLIVRMATRYGVDPDKMVHTLKETAFKGNVTNEQLMALLIVAERYSLNPWLKEIYAFPSQGGGIVPIVGLDGWSRIINSDPQFDGMEFVDQLDEKGAVISIECVIHRKDRTHATRAREYMAECKRDTPPWKSHPRRMLRHKALIQCARLAFGFVGVFDHDEAERILEAEANTGNARLGFEEANPKEVEAHFNAIVDILNADKDEYFIAEMLRDYSATYLNPSPEVALAVADKLKRDGIINKAKFAAYMKLERPPEGDEKIPL